MNPMYITIEPVKTGARMRELLRKNGLSVNDIRCAMGFENPQAIYKWLSGKSLPNLDNFVILSELLHTNINDILVIDGDVVFFIVVKATRRKMLLLDLIPNGVTF